MTSYSGSFLIAKHTLRDPNFHQSVVLLLEHNDEGAFGLIVNRPVPVKELPYPVYAGGPCEAQGLFMLHGKAEWASIDDGEDVAKEIAPGIYMGDADCASLLASLSKKEMKRVRMFAGYAGWGPGQLEYEVSQGAWALTPADGKTLFETSPKELWNALKPPSLPQPSIN